MALANRFSTPLVSFLALIAPPCLAGEAYVGVGVPGVMVGYARAVNDLVVLRADYATLGSRSQDGNEEGINYQGRVKAGRLGLFADYFPLGNGFRVTGGLTFNQMKVDLNSDFRSGDVITVGGTTLIVPPGSYYFNVHVKVPEVTPYLGIGWGHRGQEAGWGLVADLGASIGQAKVAVDTNVASAGVSQADIDRETQEIRDGVGKVRFVPQISLGASYRY